VRRKNRQRARTFLPKYTYCSKTRLLLATLTGNRAMISINEGKGNNNKMPSARVWGEYLTIGTVLEPPFSLDTTFKGNSKDTLLEFKELKEENSWTEFELHIYLWRCVFILTFHICSGAVHVLFLGHLNIYLYRFFPQKCVVAYRGEAMRIF
jgi:hypothetical protein